MSETKHTPTPWFLGCWREPKNPDLFGYHTVNIPGHSGAIRVYGTLEAQINAAFIVQAVNSHDRLVEALDNLAAATKQVNDAQHAELEINDAYWSVLYEYTNKALAVLAKAKA